ncbi:MAG: hypothetical protein PHX83_15035 [Acidobacteriia bacterium]|nr:hypothetical protein [Terriglobia bacterium]
MLAFLMNFRYCNGSLDQDFVVVAVQAPNPEGIWGFCFAVNTKTDKQHFN